MSFARILFSNIWYAHTELYTLSRLTVYMYIILRPLKDALLIVEQGYLRVVISLAKGNYGLSSWASLGSLVPRGITNLATAI